MELNIAHLYPEILNLYSDSGNIASLKKRAEWRNIDVNINEYKLDDIIDFKNTDILLIGGGSDKEQFKVCKKLTEYRDELEKYIENNGVVIAICGGFEILGKNYKINNETIRGIGILDIYTEYSNQRLIDDIIIQPEFLKKPIVGFENHGGRTYINNHKPFGKVIHGNGNNGTDGFEGIMYKNLIGTYIHGPLLPKNPHLCDYIIKKALQNKYENVVLQDLDDSVEYAANEFIQNRFRS